MKELHLYQWHTVHVYIYILDCPRVELYALSELYRITCVYLLNPFTICTFYSFQGENDFWKSCNAFIIYEYVFIDVKPLFIIFILIFCTLNLKSVNYEQYHIWVEITYRSNLTGTNMTWRVNIQWLKFSMFVNKLLHLIFF